VMPRVIKVDALSASFDARTLNCVRAPRRPDPMRAAALKCWRSESGDLGGPDNRKVPTFNDGAYGGETLGRRAPS
jgi:hypothetical protein